MYNKKSGYNIDFYLTKKKFCFQEQENYADKSVPYLNTENVINKINIYSTQSCKFIFLFYYNYFNKLIRGLDVTHVYMFLKIR